MQQIIYTNDLVRQLSQIIRKNGDPDRIIWLTDTNTHQLCLPLFGTLPTDEAEIVIPADDTHKTLATLEHVWCGLQEHKATRHSLLINLGGGMVTDLGGFAAATFKRGIRFINIPTTLLAMVDASVGGKTGINFGGLKNEVGSFAEAEAVLICTDFLHTLDHENLCSGFAEMLKHALLSNEEMFADHARFDLNAPQWDNLQDLVRQSIECKQEIVAADPHEKGLRKALNLGHTVGHAIESLMMERGTPVLHGYAVAWGLVCELFISAVQMDFPKPQLYSILRFVTTHYGRPAIACDDYEQLYQYMQHDKKNEAGRINFTLLTAIGKIALNCQVERKLINEAFDYLREA